jgi:YD repeat-containing protein
VVVTQAYNAAGNVTAITAVKAGSVYVNLAYEYRRPGSAADDTALRSAVTDRVTGTRTGYGYDPEFDQLTTATSTRAGSIVKTYTYGYNPNGHRVTATVNGVATGYTYNAAGQLTAVTGPGAGTAAGTYGYDGNGNQTSGGGRMVAYNDRDQTTTVNTDGASYEDIDQAHRATLGARGFLNTPLGITRYTDPAAVTDVIREPTGQLAALRCPPPLTVSWGGLPAALRLGTSADRWGGSGRGSCPPSLWAPSVWATALP